MPSDINEEILKEIDKIKEDEDKNVKGIKEFINEALQLEYNVSDQSKPNVKKHYDKMIAKHNSD